MMARLVLLTLIDFESLFQYIILVVWMYGTFSVLYIYMPIETLVGMLHVFVALLMIRASMLPQKKS